MPTLPTYYLLFSDLGAGYSVFNYHCRLNLRLCFACGGPHWGHIAAMQLMPGYGPVLDYSQVRYSGPLSCRPELAFLRLVMSLSDTRDGYGAVTVNQYDRN
ncbi:hypothetical protein M758_2G145800 [Ceratodon purpureus]|nr:hypothetical protein M758_2G145800 [Ceratodon purpureus]